MTMTCILPNGVTIAYTVSGEREAPPMVLLHGGANDHTAWDQVLPSLAQTHRVYALDQRGHGQSSRTDAYSFELMRDDLLGFLDALGLDRVVLVGHSMGGTVAWLFAPHHGDRLTRMVIVDVAPNRPGDPKIDIWPRPDNWDRPAEYEAVAAVLSQLNDPDPAWTTDLARITTPTLVIAGGEKSHVDQARLAEIVASLPDARLVTIPVGHGVHKDAPDEFVAAVQDFLSS